MEMCIVCWNSVQKHFPLLTKEEQIDILWCGTAYPAGCGEQVDQQLAELTKKSNGSFEDAMEISHREFDEIWERTRSERENYPDE